MNNFWDEVDAVAKEAVLLVQCPAAGGDQFEVTAKLQAQIESLLGTTGLAADGTCLPGAAAWFARNGANQMVFLGLGGNDPWTPTEGQIQSVFADWIYYWTA